MCFDIAKKQKKWDEKIVYKVVRKKDRSSILADRPLHYPDGKIVNMRGRITYGTQRKIGLGGKGILRMKNVRVAYRGIYVYKLIGAARQSKLLSQWYEDRVIIECAVSKKDFLFHNESNNIATYKSVRVIGEVS